MGTYSLAIGAASVGWFIAAAALFFNKPVDVLYRGQESHPAVRTLPNTPGTIAKILGAVAAQCVLWALVYGQIAPSLGDDWLTRGLGFAAIIFAVKLVPRDIDRLLLTTYPLRRMGIEFVIGTICALVVGVAFAITV